MKILEQVSFKGTPTVLAAWPGMGNVGLIAVDYLRRKLNAKIFAEIDMSPFFIPDSIIVKDGIAQFPEIPTAVFYYSTDPDLIIFESNAQVAGKEGILVVKMILDIITQYHIKRIFTFAAFAQPMSYQDDTVVLVTCNIPHFLDELRKHGLTPMPDGFIAGLNGLFLGVAASREIEAACLLGTIPGYAINMNYPKASLEILNSVSRILNIKIDTEEISEAVESIANQFTMIEERIKEFVPNINKEEDEEISEIEEEKVPDYVMEKIEKMFQEATRDRTLASELKKELDRWNLFELYENRFLDLFEEK